MKIIGEHIFSPVLTKSGFALSSSKERHPASSIQFYKHEYDHSQYIDFQRDKWWKKSSGRFTINIGVFYPHVHEMMTGRHLEEPPIGMWTMSQRLGILAYGHDTWWTLDNRTNIEQLGHELLDLWQQYGELWLDSVNSLTKLRTYYLKEHSLWGALVIDLVNNDVSSAKEQFRSWLVLWKGETRPSSVEDRLEFALQHSLITPDQKKTLRHTFMQEETRFQQLLDEFLRTTEPMQR